MTWNYLNPFIEYPNWPGHTQTRYKHAERILGRENLAAAMHSKTFQTALQIFPDEHWLLPFDRIDANRDGLGIFTLIQRIPYLRHYDSSRLPEFFRGGDISQRNRTIHTIQLTHHFHSIHPHLNSGQNASLAHSRSRAKTARVMLAGERCTCRLNLAAGMVNNPKPLVEICEFDQIPGDSASINSGVRSLSNIKKGATIGKYTGEFIHLDVVEDSDDYAFDFWPSTFIGKSGPDAGTEQDCWGKTSSVTAQVTGNWLRFVNQSRSSRSVNNCMFRQYTISGQMRFVIQARLDIRFRDLLTCHYGMNYFKKETPDKKRGKTKGRRSRKMVIRWESDGPYLL
jgi:hypothetical protein